MANCWLKKTPFQLALILLLMVTITFFLLLLSVYLTFAFVWNESEDCESLCVYTQQNFQEGGDERALLHPGARLQRNLTPLPEEDIAVAALLDRLYADDNDEYILKCSAIILSENWALAPGECVKQGVSAIRIGSWYWSKEGTLKKIKKVEYSQNSKLALVNFEKTKVNGVGIEPIGENQNLQSFSWINSLNLPLVQRKKYHELSAFDIPSKSLACQSAGNMSCYLTERQDCDIDVNGPILTEIGTFVGFHLTTQCPRDQNFAIVLFIEVYSFKDWLDSVLK